MIANLHLPGAQACLFLRRVDNARVKGGLHIAEKITNGRFSCRRDADQGIHGNIFHAALDLADIFGIQISKFCQLFLGQFRISTVKADCFGQQFAMFQDFGRHKP